MKYGFYNDLDTLRHDDPDADFSFLETIAVTKDFNAFNFLHGRCDEFAASLSDHFGYEIECIRHYEDEDLSGKLIHAYCISEINGQKAYIDIRGITTDPELFFEEFENEATYYPEDGELWDLDGPVSFEWWPNKDSLFDGDYEGWSDNEIREFIIVNSDQYSPDTLQRLCAGLNTTFRICDPDLIGALYHVGTMDISRKSLYSYEGNGLSVSNCPDSWRRITEGYTHGDCFLLAKPELKLLDYYALTKEETAVIQNWAVEQGYVQRGKLYKSISWDEEGNEFFSLHDSYDKALFESDADEERVISVDGLLPTEKLLDQAFVKVELLNIPDIITGLYAEQVLEYDGIYWDEVLDELAFSAPRGVIFNSKISSFDVINTSKQAARKPALNDLIASACSRCGNIDYSSQDHMQPVTDHVDSRQ